MKTRYQYILPVVFILLLVIPNIISISSNYKSDKTNENRQLAQLPKLDFENLGDFPKAFNSYYNDHFGFRKTGLMLYNHFNYFFLKKSPIPDKAILGKDNWLFKGRDIDIYRGKERLTPEELTTLETHLRKREEYLKEKGCKLMIVLVPMKKEIYSEYVPDEYYRLTSYTLTDQFLDMVKNKTDIEILDVRDKLKSEKKYYPELYHKHDNHWNDIGAFYTYQEIIKRLNTEFDLGEPRSIDEYEIVTTECKPGSIARLLGVDDVIKTTRTDLNPLFKVKSERLEKRYEAPKRCPHPWIYERRYSTSNDSLPRLLMVNDSFGEYLYPLLSEHFSYSIFLFDTWEYKLHTDKLDTEKPDIFIMCMVESLIPNLLRSIDKKENQIPQKQ